MAPKIKKRHGITKLRPGRDNYIQFKLSDNEYDHFVELKKKIIT